MPTVITADASDEEDEATSLRKEVEHLNSEIELQIEQRRQMQDTLDAERSRGEALAKQNEELLKCYEDKLQGQQHMTSVETQELSSQVDTLLQIKRHLFQRVQELESERAKLLTERQAAMRERTCVVCMDRTANTVLFRCKHLVCCEVCASKVSDCPVCRQAVRDRLTVFVCC